MQFKNYYEGLVNKRKKQAFREKIIDTLGINPATFYSWLHRGKVPKKHHCIIAEVTEVKTSELFTEVEPTKK